MKLSIIIPTFNRAKLLTEAVESILNQNPPVYEVVIADDGSNDDTQFLCAEWQKLESPTRILVTRSENNRGSQVSRNRGINTATGDYFLFMDSDDVLAENALLPLLSELEEDINLDYVYGQVIIVNSQLQPLNDTEPIGSAFANIPREIAGYHWHTMGAIYRRSYIQKVGFWHEKLTGSQDWEFQARVKMTGGKGKFVKHLVGLWRDHTGCRVGTKSFRYDYVQSVVDACVMIRDQAIQLNLIDSALEARLAKKILLHALGFSVNKNYLERNKNAKIAIAMLDKNLLMKFVVYLWYLLPVKFDHIILWFLQFRIKHN